jgi:hypothetical protein
VTTDGRTRLTADGRWEVRVDGHWVCGEPVEANPEGMCAQLVDAGPCPTHKPAEAASWLD